VVTDLSQPAAGSPEVDPTFSLNRLDVSASSTWFNPMLQESAQAVARRLFQPDTAPPPAVVQPEAPPVEATVNAALATEPGAGGHQGAEQGGSEASRQGMQAPRMPFQAGSDHQFSSQTSQLEAEESLAGFIKEVARPVVPTILKAPARKAKHLRQAEATTTRRSGRLAEKALKKGHRSAEEMAQEVLCNKLDGALDQPDKVESARERLTKLFDAPLPDDAMEAIEDLLEVINLEGKRGGSSKKVGEKAAVAPA
jgi:hypothetical protein